ncbi:hypothetical protein AKG11_32795 [Shinella sp. SUS2]|jgi:hypothetical protein|uniref:hypothetical protein n=1 Tax=unclassified Shinella TaxID=2643062 RepID=UPI000681F752|nr:MULTISPECIES: hypothetical protein [unclassified Shinella]KNY11856.1 hypothetical protein AKG11_32795 [Shinella sp. SUS2]KOC71527.1 hypothetical protein AKG10_32505 [Shinella sp. GWS1]MCA0338619.1 hypothetical protein [Pseudomonadota bacterium]
MVKSPWKLLTGLLSRGKTADQHDVGHASFTEIPKEVEGPGANSTASEASIGGEPTPQPKPSAASQGGKGEAGDRQEPPPSMAAEVADSVSADEAIALAPDRTVVIIGAKRRNPPNKAPRVTRKKAKVELPGHPRDADAAIALAEKAVAKEPDPVRTLDSEIRKLRFQLAVKLRLQNDQLRQMLSRFESK